MIEIYLRADIDLANDKGYMKHIVVITACKHLNTDKPFSELPVIDSSMLKSLHVLTNSFVTIKIKK
jgi:hypothetical protein